MEYVYFFRETGRPYVKIGMSTNDVQSRFISFKMYAPLGAYIVGYIKTKNSLELERKLHLKYKDKRMQGEFFHLTDDEVYNEINLNDSSFGQVVSLVDELINLQNMDINDLKKDLINLYNSRYKIEEKYKPDDFLLNFISNNKGKQYTNNMIVDMLNDQGYKISQYVLGIILKNLGIKKKRKRMNGMSALVYSL